VTAGRRANRIRPAGSQQDSGQAADRQGDGSEALLSARLYEWECAHVLGRTDQDVAFWVEVAKTAPGPCLELACGTGRVSVPLAEAGVDVVGLDRDATMLTLATRRQSGLRRLPDQQRAQFVAGDMRRFALHRRFGAVLIPYNSIQLLTEQDDQRACLTVAAEHLLEGGVIGLEVTDFQQGASLIAVDDEVLYRGWLGEDRVTLIGSLTHDLGRRISRYRRRFVSSAWTREDEATIRSLDQAELGDLLSGAALAPLQWWRAGAVTRVVAAPSAALSSSRCRDRH
jgi:SAM-dependent methyltransferase